MLLITWLYAHDYSEHLQVPDDSSFAPVERLVDLREVEHIARTRWTEATEVFMKSGRSFIALCRFEEMALYLRYRNCLAPDFSLTFVSDIMYYDAPREARIAQLCARSDLTEAEKNELLKLQTQAK